MKRLDTSNLLAVREAIEQDCRGKRIVTGHSFGIEVLGGRFFAKPSGCCPLGALLVGEEIEPPSGSDRIDAALNARGLETDWYRAFYIAFDDLYAPPSHRGSWAYRLGRHFRALWQAGRLGVGP